MPRRYSDLVYTIVSVLIIVLQTWLGVQLRLNSETLQDTAEWQQQQAAGASFKCRP